MFLQRDQLTHIEERNNKEFKIKAQFIANTRQNIKVMKAQSKISRKEIEMHLSILKLEISNL